MLIVSEANCVWRGEYAKLYEKEDTCMSGVRFSAFKSWKKNVPATRLEYVPYFFSIRYEHIRSYDASVLSITRYSAAHRLVQAHRSPIHAGLFLVVLIFNSFC